MSQSLYFQFNPDKNRVVTTKGDPVWPVHTAAELEALKSLCFILGASLDVPNTVLAPSQMARDEVVVGIGEAVANETALYAFLTSRVLRIVYNLKEIEDDPLPAVVVAEPHDVNAELFDVLYGRMDADFAPGIVCAPAGAALRQQVLLRSAAAAIQANPSMRRIDYNGLHSLVEERGRGFIRLGANAPRDVVRKGIESGAGVLTIATHSDGVDAYLGPDFAVCNMLAPPLDVAPQHSPSCKSQGECYRLKCSVEDALARNALLSPMAFRCCILVWNTCYSWIDDKSVLDPRWGILMGLLGSSTVGAIVAVPSIFFNDIESQGLIDPMSVALASGVCLGTAVAHANRKPLMKRLRQFHTLFGDPRTRLLHIVDETLPNSAEDDAVTPIPLQNLVEENGDAAGEHVTIANRNTTQRGGLSFLACMIRHELAWLKDHVKTADLIWDEKHTRNALLAFNAFSRYLEANRGRTTPPDIITAKFRREWAGFLVSSGRRIFNWLEFARHHEMFVDERICPNCERPARSYVTQLVIPETEDRRVTVCPCCQLIEDAPLSSNLELVVGTSNKLHLRGTLPLTNWEAKVRVWAQARRNGETFEWVRDSDGLPSRDFHFPHAPSVTGVCSVYVAIVHDFDFTVLGTRLGLRGSLVDVN